MKVHPIAITMLNYYDDGAWPQEYQRSTNEESITMMKVDPKFLLQEPMEEMQDEEFSSCSDETPPADSSSSKKDRLSFPLKVHSMLDIVAEEGLDHIVSWIPGTNIFRVHRVEEFVSNVMSRFFNQSKYKSFQRQLNIWGFQRVPTGVGAGGYAHECFVRDEPSLCISMKRVKIKGMYKRREQELKGSSPSRRSKSLALERNENASLASSSIKKNKEELKQDQESACMPVVSYAEQISNMHMPLNYGIDQSALLIAPLPMESSSSQVAQEETPFRCHSSLLPDLPPEDLKYVLVGIQMGSSKELSNQGGFPPL